MLAKFQGLVVNAVKIEDMPAYRLYKERNFLGCIFLDTNIFMVCANPFDKENVLTFPIDPKTFQLLNYDMIDAAWLAGIIDNKIMSIKDIAEILNTSESTIYRWKNGEIDIPGQVKPGLFSLIN